MRICPYCRSSVDDNSKFCIKCGAAISAEKQPGQNVSFCPTCGERLSARSAFCPTCGTAVQRRATPTSARKPATSGGVKPRVIGIAAASVAAVVAIVVAVIMFLPGRSSAPAQQFLSYQEELFMNDFLADLSSGLDRYNSGFSSDITITASVDDSMINAFLADASINLGVDLKDNSLIASGDLVLFGSSIFGGTVTYDNGTVGFLLPQVDDSYYVMDLQQVIRNLSGENIDFGALQMPDISGQKMRSLIEAYLDIMYSTVTENNVTVEKNKSVSLPGLGGSFTGTVYTFKPTAKDIENMIVKLANHLESDKDLRELIMQLVGSEAMAPFMGVYGSGYSLEDELDEALLELAGEMRSEAQQIGREVENSGFTWTLAVEGKNVRQICISTDAGANAFAYEAQGTEASGRTELIYVTSYGTKQDLVERTYTKTGDTYEGRIIVNGGTGEYYDYYTDSYISYENKLTLDYKLDNSKTSVLGIPYGEYSISVTDYGETNSVSLTVAAGANGGVDHTISIFMDDDYYSYYGISRLDLTINATDHSTVSKPNQRPVDISNYSEQELEALFESIEEKLEYELIYNSPLAGLMYYDW